jgi:predicted Zn-dependent protease
MEIAARAGYDPAAGITLWQKMGQVARGAPPTWLSTHPSNEDRVRRMKGAMKDVAKLYEKGKANRPPPPSAAN